MRKLFFIATLLCILSCTTNQTTEKTKEGTQNQLEYKLDEYFTTLVGLDNFNGGILIKRNDSTVIKKAYNIKTDQSDKLYTSVDAQFDVHSISKLMAKACIVNLESANLIDRNDMLSKYIPDFPKGD